MPQQSMNAPLTRNLINRVAVGDMLRRRARDAGDALALADYNLDPPQKLTFAQLNARSNQIARVLRDLGAVKGDRVAVLSQNCNDVPAVMYACFKAGLVYVPLNVAMGDDDLLYVVEHAAPACIVAHPGHAERWAGLSRRLAAAPRGLVLGRAGRNGFDPIDPLIDGASADDLLDVVIEDRDPAQILYTSGTTSRPKGAVHTHLSMVMWTLSMALAFNMGRGDSILCPLPLFHIGGESHMLMCHQVGGAFVYSGFDAALYADLIEHERVAGIFLLPMMWKAMLELPGIEARDFSALRWALYAMAPMSGDVLERLRRVFGASFQQASGQTETSIMTMFYAGTEVDLPGENYWGRPIATAEQAVLDEAGNELPPGEVGEICWRGPTIMQEYYHDAEASKTATQHGWHHSGDLGKIDSFGQLLFVDRKKDMVKSGGENVSSVRVEQVICGVPGVTAVAVVGLPHPKWEEAVSAFVTVAPGATTDASEIMAECRRVLAKYEVPKHIEIVPALPATPTGKVLKHELRRSYASLFATAE